MNYRTTTRTTTQLRQQALIRPVLLALFLLTSLTLSAQTFRGGISGTINDDAGAAIPAASVKVTNKATGVARNVETGKNGEFVIPELPLGFYTIEVGKTGFQTARVNDVEVVVSTNTAVNVQLKVAAVTETVEISAESVVRIDTASTALTGIIGPKQVQELPLNGRDFRQMIQLTPGVAGTSTSINGSRTRGNNYQIDSGDNSDRVNLVGDPLAGVTQEAGLRGRRFLRRDAFAFQPAGQFGTLGRNVFYGPGFRSVDFSLFKTTQLTEQISLQFRAEMFNAFNFVNWANPNTNLNSGAAFGVSTNTRNGSSAPGIGQGEPRNVQLALKLLF